MQVVELRTQPKVGIGELLGHLLDLLASFGDLPIDSLILYVEGIEVLRELLGHVRGFAQHLTGQGLDLLHSAWASGLLLDGEVVTKFVLVLLPQEIDEELAASQHFRLHHTRHELLVVRLLLLQLFP